MNVKRSMSETPVTPKRHLTPEEVAFVLAKLNPYDKQNYNQCMFCDTMLGFCQEWHTLDCLYRIGLGL